MMVPKDPTADRLQELALAIVCPMANERSNAVRFVREVLEQCNDFGQTRFFAVLDSVSTDGTVELLRDLARSEPRLEVVWAPENETVVDAYLRGYRCALESNADWILEIDAGYSHQPSDIPKFVEKILQGYDCVFGSRFVPGGQMPITSPARRAISWGGTLLANGLLGTSMGDMTSGFEMFSRSALEKVLARGISSRGHFFQTEIKVYCRKLNVVEVPIDYRTPSESVTGTVLLDALQNLFRLVRLRWRGDL